MAIFFEPDILGPAQFFSHFSTQFSPPQKLMLAVLTDALDCFLENCGANDYRHQRLFREAKDWILSMAPNRLLPSRKSAKI
jgi:hypothetical protein